MEVIAVNVPAKVTGHAGEAEVKSQEINQRHPFFWLVFVAMKCPCGESKVLGRSDGSTVASLFDGSSRCPSLGFVSFTVGSLYTN